MVGSLSWNCLHYTWPTDIRQVKFPLSGAWPESRSAKADGLRQIYVSPQGQWEENISKSELFIWSVSFSLSVCDFIPPFLVVSRWEMSAGMGLAQQSWCLISTLIRSHLLVMWWFCLGCRVLDVLLILQYQLITGEEVWGREWWKQRKD